MPILSPVAPSAADTALSYGVLSPRTDSAHDANGTGDASAEASEQVASSKLAQDSIPTAAPSAPLVGQAGFSPADLSAPDQAGVSGAQSNGAPSAVAGQETTRPKEVDQGAGDATNGQTIAINEILTSALPDVVTVAQPGGQSPPARNTGAGNGIGAVRAVPEQISTALPMPTASSGGTSPSTAAPTGTKNTNLSETPVAPAASHVPVTSQKPSDGNETGDSSSKSSDPSSPGNNSPDQPKAAFSAAVVSAVTSDHVSATANISAGVSPPGGMPAAAPAGLDQTAPPASRTSSSTLPLPSPDFATDGAGSTPAADLVRASQMYQNAGGAEMRVSMNSDLLGVIELHAVVHQSSLTATLGVERSDVQMLFVNELPALQHSLAERSLQVAQISVMGGSIGGAMDLGAQARQPGQGRNQPAAAFTTAPDKRLPNFSDESVAQQIDAAAIAAKLAGASRISIHV